MTFETLIEATAVSLAVILVVWMVRDARQQFSLGLNALLNHERDVLYESSQAITSEHSSSDVRGASHE